MSGTPDFFYREAQRLGYVARSAFKLLQMQKQYKLIKPGYSVLDLGCAPGAWLQVACQNLGPLEKGGVVVGIDTKKVKVPSLCDARVKTVSADVMNLPREQVRALSPKQKGFSVILSDMCPLVSGISSRDAALSVELGMRAVDLAVGSSAINREESNTNEKAQCENCDSDTEAALLQRGGHLVVKLLESEDIKEFNLICKPLFRKASWLRPKATRSTSREIYLICQVKTDVLEARHNCPPSEIPSYQGNYRKGALYCGVYGGTTLVIVSISTICVVLIGRENVHISFTGLKRQCLYAAPNMRNMLDELTVEMTMYPLEELEC